MRPKLWLDLGYLFTHWRGPSGHVWEAAGPDLWPQPWLPSPTPCIFACPSVLLPFYVGGSSLGGGRIEWKGPKGFSSM